LNQKHKRILASIIFITVLVYIQTLSFDFVNWDDDYYVINNLQVTNPTIDNLKLFFTEGNTANYHPITMLSLALNYVVGGENAFGYHLLNLVLHLLNTVLLYVWVRKIWPKSEYLPLFVVGVFALHPMHVEPIAWISSRKDVLFIFFYFAALLSYQSYQQENKSKYLLITLGLFILSGLSKPTAVVFPIHLLLVDYLVNRDFSSKLVLEKIPFFGVSVLVGLATIWVQNEAGAVSIAAYSLIERLQLASYAVNLYVVKFFAPVHLASFYPYPLRPFNFWVSFSPVLSLIVGGFAFWRWRLNRNIVFGILFYLVSLVLLVQLVSVGSTIISERYTYFSYVGLCISIYFILEDLFSKSIQFNGNVFRNAMIVILIIFSVVSYKRVKVWKNGETLWTDAINKFPEVAGSWGGRGVYYRIEKRYSKALRDLNQAVKLNPNEAMFYSNRGNIYFDLGQDEKALYDYNNCIRLDSTDENAFANRGAIYGRKGRYNEALSDLSHSIYLDPEVVNAYMNRGIIYTQLNQRVQAKGDFKKCVEFEPDNHAIWNALAVAHQHLGEFDSSIVVLSKAIEIDDSEGVYFFNRGISYRLIGDQGSANADFDQAKNLGTQVDSGYYQTVN
jgi:Flp pilus assembly protein TadD